MSRPRAGPGAVALPAQPATRPETVHRNRLLRGLRRDPKGIVGLVIVVLVAVAAVAAPWLAPHDPTQQNVAARLLPPEGLGNYAGHPLGTDALGRDVLSRIIYGARVSLVVGVASVLLAGVVGVLLGLAAGYLGGRVEAVTMRLADIQLAIPSLVLAIAVMAVVRPGLATIIGVLAVTGWVVYARVVRAETLSVREREFVQAARVLGASRTRIVFRHVLPNVVTSAIVIASLEVPRMILTEASLSFLGVGVPPPTPSWGGMVADGRGYVERAPWVATYPGLAILATVIGVNLLGDWLREALDPRLGGP